MSTAEYRSHVLAQLQAAKTLLCAGDYLGIVKLLSGSYQGDLWAAAMTAHFGPIGIHPAWQNANGTPSAECLARFDYVGEAMLQARLMVVTLIGYYERHA